MTKTLYDTDFYAWTRAQAEAIRTKDWAALDVENVAEQIESLGRSDRRAITHQLQRVLRHLLEWTHQPEQRPRYGRSWRRSIEQGRSEIADLIEESQSLQDLPTQRLALPYRRARRQAAEDTGLPVATFPEHCPWPVDDVLREDWLPLAEGGEAR